MAKIDCFKIPGLECWFWSNDHDPPHFHAKRAGEWELRVNFMTSDDEMLEQQWGRKPNARLLRELKEAVKLHRAALLAEWEAKVSQ